MGSSAVNDSGISDSDIGVYMDNFYRKLKEEKVTVEKSKNCYICPFCAGHKKQEFVFEDLLQHASEILASNSKPYVKAKHQALAKYLESDFSRTGNPLLQQMVIKDSRSNEEEQFVWPWMGVLVNVPTKFKDGKYVGESGSQMKQRFYRFNPIKVHTFWNCKGHIGKAVIHFNKDWSGFNDAMNFENNFRSAHFGKKDWNDRKNLGSNIYGWVARADDFNSPGYIGGYLRINGNLSTVTNLENDVLRKQDQLVSTLNTQILDQNKHLEELYFKFDKTTFSLNEMQEQRDVLVQKYNMEIQKRQQLARDQLQKIFSENEKLRSELDSKRNELHVRNKQLNLLVTQNDVDQKQLEDERKKNAMKTNSLELAALEQKKADEDVLKLMQKQQLEKEVALNKIVQLERELDEKQELELEIQKLKGTLQVRNHLGGDDSVNNKLQDMEHELKEKIEEMEDIEAINQALIVRERRSNDELQEARKELITALEPKLTHKSSIAIKKMGDLDVKVFYKACIERFPEDAEVKADRYCSHWMEEIKNPDWHPFKVIMVDGKEEEVLREDDERLQSLKNELGDGVFKAVTTALVQINEYNPSGRYPVREIWNAKERRRASLKEAIQYVLKQWNNKRKRED